MLVLVQAGRGASLDIETPPERAVLHRLAAENFDGDLPAQRDLLGLVNHAHSAAADFAACGSRQAERRQPIDARIQARAGRAVEANSAAVGLRRSSKIMAGNVSRIRLASEGQHDVLVDRDGLAAAVAWANCSARTSTGSRFASVDSICLAHPRLILRPAPYRPKSLSAGARGHSDCWPPSC